MDDECIVKFALDDDVEIQFWKMGLPDVVRDAEIGVVRFVLVVKQKELQTIYRH